MPTLGALHRDSFPFPIREWQHEQAELIFFWNESESRMGLRSNFEAMISASAGGDPASAHAAIADYGNVELLTAPERSLESLLMRDRIESAARARLTKRHLGRMTPAPGCPLTPSNALATLFMVYGPRRNHGLEAWGLLGPLAPYTAAAGEAHAKQRARLRLRAWCERLSARLIGEPNPTNPNHRKRPTATEAETSLAAQITEEATSTVRHALFLYSRARGRG